MEWPHYYRSTLHVHRADGFVGIITGWSDPREVIRELVEDDPVGIVGTLYSKGGVNYVVRNAFLNPKQTCLVLCGEDLSQSLASFREFLSQPYHRDDRVWQAEIPDDALQEYHAHFSRHFLYCAVKDVHAAVMSFTYECPWTSENHVFPDPMIVKPSRLPSERTAFRVSGDRLSDVWPRLLQRILRYGTDKQSQHSDSVREVVTMIGVVEGPDAGEWHESFPCSSDDVERYVPSVLTDHRPETVSYTYGERLGSQVREAIAELRRSPCSRRAFASTWDREKDPGAQLPPCLTSVQFVIQDGRLFSTCYFRSHDMYRAWPLNCIALRRMQVLAAQQLECEVGPLVVVSCSAHIYDRDQSEAEKVVNAYAVEPVRDDPRGNFLIEVRDGKLAATLTTPEGDAILQFSGTARSLRDEIAPFVSDVAHGIYLGSELARAEQVARAGLAYIQDEGVWPGDVVGEKR